jgi:hypothetical protein
MPTHKEHQAKPGDHTLTAHAAVRMRQRGISARVVDLVLTYGRQIQAKGLIFCVVGRKEVAKYATYGVDLSAAEGLQVLVAPDGVVVTMYRNHDLHSIKAGSRRSRQAHSIWIH